MKKYLLFTIALTALALAACGTGSDPAPSAAPPITTKKAEDPELSAALAAFDRTEARTEGELRRAASLILKKGASLEKASADRCFEADHAPASVLEICAVLVAHARYDYGPRAATYLLEAARTSPVAATALAIKPIEMRAMNLEDLLSYLNQLRGRPAWLRANLYEAWQTEHPPLDEERLRTVTKTLRGEGPLSPYSSARLLQVLSRPSKDYFRAELAAHCRPDTPGSLRIRCWRFLAATIDLSEENRSAYRPFSTSQDDRDWRVFARSFPNLVAPAKRIFPEIQ